MAVLFARQDSIYKSFPCADVWDIYRDARYYRGPFPVVAHPPCRAWGRLRHFAKPLPDEKGLALFAVDCVRKFGGVLEHPSGSSLWPVAGLPAVGSFDSFGGFTICLPQFWFGHRANKSTKLYVCGCSPCDLPPVPLVLGDAPSVIGDSISGLPEIPKADRERTPVRFAEWLLDLAAVCSVGVAA